MLTDVQWDVIITAALEGNLVLFLGAGASPLPQSLDLAIRLATEVDYPLEADPHPTLTDVAQWATVLIDRRYAYEHVANVLREEIESLDSDPDLHQALAEMPVSQYITTNYDDIMERALSASGKNALVMVPDWTSRVDVPLGPEDHSGLEPTVEQPMVYHLHGHLDSPESLVASDDDYIEFMEALCDPKLLPPTIRASLTKGHLLFVGYSLRDWNIRLALQRVRHERLWYSLGPRPEHEGFARFREAALQRLGIVSVWGTATDFAAEISARYLRRMGSES